jgi:hypothetical protein
VVITAADQDTNQVQSTAVQSALQLRRVGSMLATAKSDKAVVEFKDNVPRLKFIMLLKIEIQERRY